MIPTEARDLGTHSDEDGPRAMHVKSRVLHLVTPEYFCAANDYGNIDLVPE